MNSNQDNPNASKPRAQIPAKAPPKGWRGDEYYPNPEDDEDADIQIEKKPIPQDELDMTPMVDVTFLLLIFFMVTASFTIQKSLEQPHAQTDAPSASQSDDQDIDFIQVTIDQTNTYYVTTAEEEEAEAPSDNEMRELVKRGVSAGGTDKMVILAHLDSKHAKVVTAYDAGTVNGIQSIQIKTTDEDY